MIFFCLELPEKITETPKELEFMNILSIYLSICIFKIEIN